MSASQAAGLQPGDPVKVTALRRAPSCLRHEAEPVDVYYGVYLGIPPFEYTVAQVRIGNWIRRFPLEYLSTP